MSRFRLISGCLLVLTGLLVSACGQVPTVEISQMTPTLAGTLRPYPSETPSATPFPTGYDSPTPSPTVTPTPTPLYYEVQEGDDMFGIAFFYGISPQALMTANPTVNPRIMGPGTTLLIPVTPGPDTTATSAVTNTPTPTPPYARLEQPVCYPDATGGLSCFVLIVNDEESALENVSAIVTLDSGEESRREEAIMPLNFLPKGAALPLIAYFQAPVPDEYTPSVEMDFYLPVMPEDSRYLMVEIREDETLYSEDRESAQLKGTLVLGGEDQDASYVWLHATAFDAEGRVVAVRRWEVKGPIEAGEALDYQMSIYSMGDPIVEISLLAEAHRQQIATPMPTPSP